MEQAGQRHPGLQAPLRGQAAQVCALRALDIAADQAERVAADLKKLAGGQAGWSAASRQGADENAPPPAAAAGPQEAYMARRLSELAAREREAATRRVQMEQTAKALGANQEAVAAAAQKALALKAAADKQAAQLAGKAAALASEWGQLRAEQAAFAEERQRLQAEQAAFAEERQRLRAEHRRLEAWAAAQSQALEQSQAAQEAAEAEQRRLEAQLAAAQYQAPEQSQTAQAAAEAEQRRLEAQLAAVIAERRAEQASAAAELRQLRAQDKERHRQLRQLLDAQKAELEAEMEAELEEAGKQHEAHKARYEASLQRSFEEQRQLRIQLETVGGRAAELGGRERALRRREEMVEHASAELSRDRAKLQAEEAALRRRVRKVEAREGEVRLETAKLEAWQEDLSAWEAEVAAARQDAAAERQQAAAALAAAKQEAAAMLAAARQRAEAWQQQQEALALSQLAKAAEEAAQEASQEAAALLAALERAGEQADRQRDAVIKEAEAALGQAREAREATAQREAAAEQAVPELFADGRGRAKVTAPPRTLRALRREQGEEGAPASPSSLRMQYCCPLDPAWDLPAGQGGEPEEDGETEADVELVQLAEAAREALGARHVICLYQPSEQGAALLAARRLLEGAPAIRAAGVDFTGVALFIDDSFDLWDEGFVSIPHDFSLCSLKSQLQALLGRYGISAVDEFSLRRAFNSSSEWYAEDGGSDWGEVHGSGACSVCSCGEAEQDGADAVNEINGSESSSEWGGPGSSGCADGAGLIDGMWAAASSKPSSALEEHLGVQAVQVDPSAECDLRLRHFLLCAHTVVRQPEALSFAVQGHYDCSLFKRLLDFLCSTVGEIVAEANEQAAAMVEEEEELLKAVRETLGAKRVICVASRYHMADVLAAARRLLESAPAIRAAGLNLAGAHLAIDERYELWDDGCVSIPYDFSLPDLKAQLQVLLAGRNIIVGDEFSLHSAVSDACQRGGDDGGEESAAEGGSGTVTVDNGSPSRELSSSSGSGTFGAGGGACDGAAALGASSDSCGADSPGACSQAEQQDE